MSDDQERRLETLENQTRDNRDQISRVELILESFVSSHKSIDKTLGKMSETIEKLTLAEVKSSMEREAERDFRLRMERRMDNHYNELKETKEQATKDMDRIYKSMRGIDQRHGDAIADLDKQFHAKIKADAIREAQGQRDMDKVNKFMGVSADRIWKILFWLSTSLVVYLILKPLN